MVTSGRRYNQFIAITPSDSVNFANGVCDAIYVGTKGSTGTIVAIQSNGIPATFVGLAAGTVLPIAAIRVNETTTDASDLVALYQV